MFGTGWDQTDRSRELLDLGGSQNLRNATWPVRSTTLFVQASSSAFADSDRRPARTNSASEIIDVVRLGD